jgi:K+-sensing histidine kinase KdpD
VWLKGTDVVKALLDFAHEKRLSRIIMGRTRLSLLVHLFDRSVTRRLIGQARDFDVHIISDAQEAQRNKRLSYWLQARARPRVVVGLFSNLLGSAPRYCCARLAGRRRSW